MFPPTYPIYQCRWLMCAHLETIKTGALRSRLGAMMTSLLVSPVYASIFLAYTRRTFDFKVRRYRTIYDRFGTFLVIFEFEHVGVRIV